MESQLDVESVSLHKAIRILVVDDDPLHNELTTFLLRYDGYQVLTAKDANEALTSLQHRQIDLIILDVMMPEISGYDLCREIRRYSDIAIIFVSARGEVDDRIRGLQLGADDYLTKPFEPAVLLARIEAVIRRSYSIHTSLIEADQSVGVTLPETRTVSRACCPYLGLKADPQSVGMEPSTVHRCYASTPRGKIDPEYQQRFCLDTIYDKCPRYTQAAIQGPTRRGVSAPFGLLATALIVALTIFAGWLYWLNGSSMPSTLIQYLPTPTAARAQAPRATTSTPAFTPAQATHPSEILAPPAAVPTETEMPVSVHRIDPAETADSAMPPTSGPTERVATVTKPVSATPEPTTTPFVAPTAKVTARIALNVRRGPGTQHAILTHLLRGDEIDVLGQNDDATWLQVRFRDGLVGWVSREYTDFDGAVPVVTSTVTTPN